jgi:hypothetical protein
MSYQAVIRNASGTLVVSQAVGMQISILPGSETGTPVYVETHTPTTNSNGLVTLEIGGGTAITGTFEGIDWSTGIYFIKTETDPAGGTDYTITGTSQLLSVPYALYADSSGNEFSGSYNDLTDQPALFDGTWNSITGKPTTVAGYGISNAVTTTGNQTIAGIKTFSSTVNADSIYLTHKTSKWSIHAHNMRIQTSASGSNIILSYIGESNTEIQAVNTGTWWVLTPIDIPFQILGCEQKIKSVTFNYMCSSANVYITNVFVRKHKQGVLTGIISSSTDYTSTTAQSVTLTCPSAVDFSDSEVDIIIGITYTGVGIANTIKFYETIVTTQ